MRVYNIYICVVMCSASESFQEVMVKSHSGLDQWPGFFMDNRYCLARRIKDGICHHDYVVRLRPSMLAGVVEPRRRCDGGGRCDGGSKDCV